MLSIVPPSTSIDVKAPVEPLTAEPVIAPLTDNSSCRVAAPCIFAVPSISKSPVADKLPLELMCVEAVTAPDNETPSAPLNVNKPPDVDKLLAAAASIDIPAVPSIVIAPLESISNVSVFISKATSESPPIVIEVPSRVKAPPASMSTVLEGVRLNDVIPVSDTAPAPSNSQVPVSSPNDAPPFPLALNVVVASIVVVVVLFMATVVALSISTGPPLAEIEPLKNKSFHL